jgi:hypothetical protein
MGRMPGKGGKKKQAETPCKEFLPVDAKKSY